MPVAGDFGKLLPVGVLAYNGVDFTVLYKSEVTATPIQDAAERTTKYVEYVLDVEAYVTLRQPLPTIDTSILLMRRLLSQDAGTLIYFGQGFGGLIVNVPGGPMRDVKWGPVTKLFHFQNLGGGVGAQIKWQIVTRLTEVQAALIPTVKPAQVISTLSTGIFPAARIGNNQPPPAPASTPPVLQYNYGATVSYSEDCFATIAVRGVIEIPMTRIGVNIRTLPDIVENYRQAWLNIQVDLTKYRVVRRHFEYSRDKRTIDWEFVAEEVARMGLPPGAVLTRGQMSVRPAGKRVGMFGSANFMQWACTLRCTYTIRNDMPMRLAAEAFYALLWFRMHSCVLGAQPAVPGGDHQPKAKQGLANALAKGAAVAAQAAAAAAGGGVLGAAPVNWWNVFFRAAATGGAGVVAGQRLPGAVAGGIAAAVGGGVLGKGAGLAVNVKNGAPKQFGNINAQPKTQPGIAMLIDFGFDEGLHLDSKITTFHATWILFCTWSTLLAGSGVWRWLGGTSGGKTWAASVQDIMGWRSVLAGKVNPTADLIVDFGGGKPPTVPPIGGA